MVKPKDKIKIFQGDNCAEIALRGAELKNWRHAGEEKMWSGDARWWPGVAPVLFPVCGSPRRNQIRVGGEHYPMPTHGFAMTSEFSVVENAESSVTLELLDSAETQAIFPFAFRLRVSFRLGETSLRQEITVENSGADDLPYSVGLHPAFAFTGGTGTALFDHDEAREIPLVENKVITSRLKPSGMVDRSIAIDTATSFQKGALCFFEANSTGMTLTDSAGKALRIDSGGFPHLILWAAEGAEFLSFEGWTGHGDPEGFDGDFAARASTTILAPGEQRRYFAEFTPR